MFFSAAFSLGEAHAQKSTCLALSGCGAFAYGGLDIDSGEAVVLDGAVAIIQLKTVERTPQFPRPIDFGERVIGLFANGVVDGWFFLLSSLHQIILTFDTIIVGY